MASDSLPLPKPFAAAARPSSVPPQASELTRRASPARSLPSPIRRTSSVDPSRIVHQPSRHPPLTNSLSPPRLHPFERRASAPETPTRQLAHQLAAETLLTMAPAGPTRPSASPEARTDTSTSVPAPAATKLTTEADSVKEEARGVKRKNEEESPRLPAPVTLGVHALEKERPKDRFSHSPLATHDRLTPAPARPAHSTSPSANASQPAAPASTTTTTSSAAAAAAAAEAANRYSIYGPTRRDPASLIGAPWHALGARYGIGPFRRDPLAASTPAAKPATPLSPPRRPSPEPLRDRLYPGSSSSTMAAYGHYSMGRRELNEHREQLREGKKWLENMLAKTEKMLHMVENKMALAPADATGSSTNATVASNPARSGPAAAVDHEDHEFEERERARQKAFARLEEERERDRLEREKRDREREQREKEQRENEQREREQRNGMDRLNFERTIRENQELQARRGEREREKFRERLGDGSTFFERGRFGLGGLGGFGGIGGLSVGSREKSEAERNRDLLLASRRVQAVSPHERERSTPGAAASTAATTNTSEANGSTGGTTAGTAKAGNGWEGEARPIMSGVALPRREGAGVGRGPVSSMWRL
ncbi:hypothetical protein BCR39DRAFT_76239 [Naematelia encephala]|uniref:Uncharacterized protein n=1 Tax=Naematelia encephala TaxID=71784 RepID=A0A1Y2AFV2_9TREE|nr:hypothetical protein BCR39DRAFT_76239 [Naematelia encephala]